MDWNEYDIEWDTTEPEEPREEVSSKPLPAGSVRVEFLDGPFKGRVTVLHHRTAEALGKRIRVVDG